MVVPQRGPDSKLSDGGPRFYTVPPVGEGAVLIHPYIGAKDGIDGDPEEGIAVVKHIEALISLLLLPQPAGSCRIGQGQLPGIVLQVKIQLGLLAPRHLATGLFGLLEQAGNFLTGIGFNQGEEIDEVLRGQLIQEDVDPLVGDVGGDILGPHDQA